MEEIISKIPETVLEADIPAEAPSAAPSKNKIFEKFKVKDIVFLAIISAVTLATCAVMPLVANIPVFGLPQIVTGLQLSIFPAIGIMKVRKPGALLFIALFTGVIQLLMAPPMFFANVTVGVLLELLVLLIFRGYKKNAAVFFAASLYNPLSLPFHYLYNYLIGKEAVTAIAASAPWLAVLMTVAVVAIAAAGTLLGMKISKELKKSGALKK